MYCQISERCNFFTSIFFHRFLEQSCKDAIELRCVQIKIIYFFFNFFQISLNLLYKLISSFFLLLMEYIYREEMKSYHLYMEPWRSTQSSCFVLNLFCLCLPSNILSYARKNRCFQLLENLVIWLQCRFYSRIYNSVNATTNRIIIIGQ